MKSIIIAAIAALITITAQAQTSGFGENDKLICRATDTECIKKVEAEAARDLKQRIFYRLEPWEVECIRSKFGHDAVAANPVGAMVTSNISEEVRNSTLIKCLQEVEDRRAEEKRRWWHEQIEFWGIIAGLFVIAPIVGLIVAAMFLGYLVRLFRFTAKI
ncbi:hypothetical protein [Sinorhizobium chiapasense]|uniref:Transmembrane protein n=1 Tax=Sinorhizobium chiapasense TaxID=501572 RepID=A0ABZ2B833_9HYPH